MTHNKRKQARPGQRPSGVLNSKDEVIKRFKVIPLKSGPYKSDRWIWNGAMLLIFFWLWLIAYQADYNLDYFKCGDGERLYIGAHQTCPNPFYNPANDWKCHEELAYGEYGTRPSSLFNNAGIVTVVILVLAGLFNHIIHNRRRNRN